MLDEHSFGEAVRRIDETLMSFDSADLTLKHVLRREF
jgi:hypothetical protein